MCTFPRIGTVLFIGEIMCAQRMHKNDLDLINEGEYFVMTSSFSQKRDVV